MRHSSYIYMPLALCVSASVCAENTSVGVDMSQWQCKWCPQEIRASDAVVTGGLGYVTNDSEKFGDFNALDKKGVHLIADVEASRQYESGAYFGLKGTNLGLDSRRINVEGGNEGSVRVGASFDQLIKLNEGGAQTPYTGTIVQRLPSGWVPASNTSGMTSLSGSLKNVDLSTERRKTAIGASYYQTEHLSYSFSFQHETKKGSRSAGLGFGSFRSSILALPVDYESDIASVGVNYHVGRWQIGADYQVSAFNNQINSVRWDNAFSSPATTTEGQAAQEPDNAMQQISISGFLRATDAISISAVVAVGQMQQDQNYLPYTINGGIASPNLPRSSLDGKVNTADASVNLSADLSEKVALNLKYKQHEQDNLTSRATYNYVIADTALAGTARTNNPYSFQQKYLQGELRYQVNTNHKISAGAELDTYERTYQEVETTEEAGLWGLYNAEFPQVGVQVRLDYADRNGDDYQAVSGGVAGQNPLMRKYNLADRSRNKAGLSLSYSPKNYLDLGVSLDFMRDDYSDSEIGLKESNEANLSVDVRYQIDRSLTLNALYAHTNIKSTQAGSSSASAPDWEAEHDDRIDVLDFGLLYQLRGDKLSIGFNYTYANSVGKVDIINSSFPDLAAERHTLKIYGDYKLTRNSLLNLAFLYEKYDEENWAKDGVNINSIDNVLSLGEVTPSYNIAYATLSYRYKF